MAQQPHTPALHEPAAQVVPLRAGARAPELGLPATFGDVVRLDRFRGCPLVIAFYPADWEPLSLDQLSLFQTFLPNLRALGAEILGVSVDSVWSHARLARELGLAFPLLSDFHPQGAVARAYGVLRAEEGRSERAIFVVDGRQVIRWSHVAPDGADPGVDGILTALEEIAAGAAPT
jgi:peroxiredoxin